MAFTSGAHLYDSFISSDPDANRYSRVWLGAPENLGLAMSSAEGKGRGMTAAGT